MKPGISRAAVLWAALAGSVAMAPARAADVGVSINISPPGVHGRIDIGRFPQPQVIVQQPVIIARPAARALEPVYLWVPPGHQKQWRRHCGAYNACGVPVYFVQERWYRDHVMRDERRSERWADRRSDRRDDRRDDRHDDRRDGDRGHGHGHGRH